MARVAVAVGVLVLGAFVWALVAILRDRRPRGHWVVIDGNRIVNDALAQAQQDYVVAADEYYGCQDKTGPELPRQPVDAHDRYPHLSQDVREVCIDYLERMYALPEAEVDR